MSDCSSQICEGGAEFRLLTEEDLSGGWEIDVSAGTLEYVAGRLGVAPSEIRPQVVVELPDYAWAWKYQRWASSRSDPRALGVMVVSAVDFRGQGETASLAAAQHTYRSLFETGLPAPFFARIFPLAGN